MDSKFDYRLTQYKPKYTMYLSGPDRYAPQGADTRAGSMRDPEFRAQSMIVRSKSTEELYREQALNTYDTVASRIGNGGYQNDIAALKIAAQEGDFEGFRQKMDEMQTFARDNRGLLLQWERVDGGPVAEVMSTNAKHYNSQDFLDEKLKLADGTDATLRDFWMQTTPEVRVSQARHAAKLNRISLDAATVLTDKSDSRFGFLNSLRDDLSRVQTLTSGKREAASLDSEQFDKLQREEFSIKEAQRLYSEHIAQTTRDGVWDGAESFYNGAYTQFGNDISEAQLSTLMEQFRIDKRVGGTSFSADRWFRDRQAAMSNAHPKIPQLTYTKDSKGQLKEHQVLVNDPALSTEQIFDTVMFTSDLLRNNVPDLSVNTRRIEESVGTELAKLSRVQQISGVHLSDFGFGSAAAHSAAYNLNRGAVDREAQLHHQVLDATANFVQRTANALGRDGTGASTVLGKLRDLDTDIMKIATSWYLENFKKTSLSLNAAMKDPELITRITTVVEEDMEDIGIPANPSLAGQLAARVVENMNTGRAQSLREMLMEIADYQTTVVDPGTGTVTVDQHPPGKYTDLRTGKVVQGNVSFDSRAGALGTDHWELHNDVRSIYRAQDAFLESFSDRAGIAPDVANAAAQYAATTIAEQNKSFSDSHYIENNMPSVARQQAAARLFYDNVTHLIGPEYASQIPIHVQQFLQDPSVFVKVSSGAGDSPAATPESVRPVVELLDWIGSDGFLNIPRPAAAVFLEIAANAADWATAPNSEAGFSPRALGGLVGIDILGTTPPPFRFTAGLMLTDGLQPSSKTSLPKLLDRFGLTKDDLQQGRVQTGLLWATEAPKTAKTLHQALGRIASAWDIHTRKQPPLTDAPSTTVPTQVSAPRDAESNATQGVRDAAVRMLALSYNRDEAVNEAKIDLSRTLGAQFTDATTKKSIVDNLMPEVDRIVHERGVVEGLDWVKRQRGTRYLFVQEQQAPSAPGQPARTVIRLKAFSPDQLEEYAKASGTDVTSLTVGSAALEQEYRRQQEYQQALGLKSHAAHLNAMFKE